MYPSVYYYHQPEPEAMVKSLKMGCKALDARHSFG